MGESSSVKWWMIVTATMVAVSSQQFSAWRKLSYNFITKAAFTGIGLWCGSDLQKYASSVFSFECLLRIIGYGCGCRPVFSDRTVQRSVRSPHGYRERFPFLLNQPQPCRKRCPQAQLFSLRFLWPVYFSKLLITTRCGKQAMPKNRKTCTGLRWTWKGADNIRKHTSLTDDTLFVERINMIR